MLKELSGTFIILKKCKNSVRYSPEDEESKKLTSGFYLMNDSFIELGQPETIIIEVSSESTVS